MHIREIVSQYKYVKVHGKMKAVKRMRKCNFFVSGKAQSWLPHCH
jgi:hypothetical protein